MTKSTHKVEVVRLGAIEKHPNADRLGITTIFSGYTAVVALDQFHEGDLAAYVPPDSLVNPDHPGGDDKGPFAFLAGVPYKIPPGSATPGYVRIKVKKLRGVVSMGLLVPVPACVPLTNPLPGAGAGVFQTLDVPVTEGMDLADYFDVHHYEPPEPLSTGGEDAPAPKGVHPYYDVDSLRRYAHVFEPGELVWVSEKLHGANARYTFDGETLHVGSRTAWKRPNPKSIWWKALDAHPEIEMWCREYEHATLYGEVYGQVQDLKYGVTGVRFAAFDVLSPAGIWFDPPLARELVTHWRVPWVPVIVKAAPFHLETMLRMAEGPSLVPGADHVREGIVVRPVIERTHPEVGRVMLKVAGNGYLERA